MDATKVGREFRALRIRRRLRQADLGRTARVSRALISRIERGLIESVPAGTLVRVAAPLGAVVDIRLRWNGEQLDRLLDEAHARIVEVLVSTLQAAGWEAAVEVSFSIRGEQGSIDLLAFHPDAGVVLVGEIKSVVPDSQATIHGLDRKARLARQIAAERGWEVRAVARILVIGASATSRRRIARLAATYDVAFPLRGRAVRAWLAKPRGAISGLLFVAYAPRGSTNHGVAGQQRIRRRRAHGHGSVGAPNAPGESGRSGGHRCGARPPT